MRTIQELMGNNERVWVYLPDDRAKDSFYDEAVKLGLYFDQDKALQRDQINERMAVHADGSLAYVSIMVWHHSYDPQPAEEDRVLDDQTYRNCPKIDYMKYIEGEDYLLTKSIYREV